MAGVPLALAVTLLVPVPSAAAADGAVAPASSSPMAPAARPPAAMQPATVTVRLKRSWRVTKARQLTVKDGAMTCQVTRLVRKKPRPATAAVLTCTVPESLVPTEPLKVVVKVKGRAGARASALVSFTAQDQVPGPTGDPTGGTGTGGTGTGTGGTGVGGTGTGGTGSGGTGTGGGGSTPPAAPPTTSPGAVSRINTDADGNGGNAEAGSPTWSPDGTKVAFISKATNLVAGVADGCSHVYLKTLATGTITVVDRSQSGVLGNGCPSYPMENSGLSFAPTGDWLLFCSAADNLGPGSPLGGEDVFGKNLVNGAVEWFGPGCMWPTWSPDGTKIAFATDVDLACPGNANNGNYDIYVIDRNSPLTQCSDFYRVSSDSSGNQTTWSGPMSSERPVFSPDSSRILFESTSPFLVPNDTNVAADLFVKDLGSGATTRVSTGNGDVQGSGASERGAWSPDGSKVLFQSRANDFFAGDTNVHEDIFVKDLATRAITMVSTKSDGSPVLFEHRNPSWAPDGTRIAFASKSVDLVPSDANLREDVFVKNLSSGFVQLVSSSAAGVEGESSSGLFLSSPRAWSPDGTRIVFESNAQNLAPADGNAFAQDLFVKVVS